MVGTQIAASWRGLDRLAKGILILVLLAQIPVLYLVVNNMPCDFSLDRAQYEHLAQIARVYDGNPVYTPMTVEFSPITYTPLYWVVCGWIWKLAGPGFFFPQLVSLLASLALFTFVARFLWAGTGRNLFLTALGVFDMLLISFVTGFWLFQISVDALHFALTVAGFYCLTKTSSRSTAWAAVWLSLGALTKQTGLAYVAAGALYVLLKSPRKFLFYAGAALVICGGGLAYLQLSSGGQFYKVIVTENQGPFWDSARLLREVWGSQFFGQVLILLLCSLWPIVSSKSLRAAWGRLLTPEVVMAASGMLVASIAQPKFGSGNNHAVVAMAGLVICGWQGLQVAASQIRERKGPRWNAVFPTVLSLTVVLQTILLLVPAWKMASVRFIDTFDRLRYEQVEGVFKKGYTILYHFPYITRSFGYPEAGHQGNEMCRWIHGQWNWANKPDFLSEPYREQRFDYVVLCASVVDQGDPTIRAILDNYSISAQLPAHLTRPNTLMLRYPLFVLRANRLGGRK